MDSNGDDILRYHKGELSAAERHALEKKALSDPFLADALEGAGQIPVHHFAQDVTALQQKIKGSTRSSFTPLRVAAGIALLAATGWLGLYLIENNQQDQLALREQQPAPSSAPAAKDSAQADYITKAEEQETEPAEEPTKKDQLLALESARQGRKEHRPAAAKQDPAPRELETKPAEGLTDHVDLIVSAAGAASQGELVEDSAAAPIAQQPVQELSSGGETRAAKARTQGIADDVVPIVPMAIGIGTKEIKGKVTLAEDGLALPGVSVLVKGSSRGTVTDLNGNYSLDAGEEKPTLVFSFIGMQTTEASPSSGPTLDVALAEDVSQLSEVVVTGKKIPSVSNDDNPVIKLAEPVGGFKAYDKYLDGNLHYPQQALENDVKGRVTIQFTVGINGDLDEFTVMKSLGFGCDEEVIRLVKEGPAWNPTTENKVPTESLVRVRMKFDAAKVKR